ncbi:DUF4417 domain-containing protein [Hydrogenoanaerobacterium sp.]|uniref:DUF4417 domain-containing protein n=1 Tax=Hydrogenoanaerobacterium sp. TaxID=2953763 RepID=UPI00289FCAF4|nr:DUF4417 domain-containing protein [Hydrogenoanaerobacterium sp.]
MINLECNYYVATLASIICEFPDNDIEKLRRYRAVLSPDFSVYLEMNPTIQLYNTFRNRWCGAYFASKGIRVIPSVSWGNENTFNFCFMGIPKGSIVAVSTYMVSEHNNHQDQKEIFLKGYNEMLRQIEPERIICYNQPFPEMQGNIIFVDYELSSWKYQNDDYKPSKYIPYILGKKVLPENSDIVIKSGYVMRDDAYFKGMGSTYGGAWKPSPNKPDDQRFLGKPGEKKITFTKNGEKFETKIGDNGKAVKERHYTDHNKPWAHTNPHDHNIDWDSERGNPLPGSPINYPNDAPEFKSLTGGRYMKNMIMPNSKDQDRFSTISEFKWCINDGGEVEFTWRGKTYDISRIGNKISICQALKQETEKLYDTTEELLEYLVDDNSLRDIITQVEVLYRTI